MRGDAPGRAHRRGCAELFLRHALFWGGILLLANSIDQEPAVVRFSAESKRVLSQARLIESMKKQRLGSGFRFAIVYHSPLLDC